MENEELTKSQKVVALVLLLFFVVFCIFITVEFMKIGDRGCKYASKVAEESLRTGKSTGSIINEGRLR